MISEKSMAISFKQIRKEGIESLIETHAGPFCNKSLSIVCYINHVGHKGNVGRYWFKVTNNRTKRNRYFQDMEEARVYYNKL